MSSDKLRIVYSENPVKEIWSRLSYFETEHNVRQFLKKNFSFKVEDKKEKIDDIASSLSFTMQTAKEYYESADRVSLLTRPLLIFYGMTALSKVLFISTRGEKSPSQSHGLQKPKPRPFTKLSTSVSRDGTFPQFHSCYSKEKIFRRKFTMKELLSLVPEIKVEYETVYNEKSRALKILRTRHSVGIVDTEIEKYGKLATNLGKFFPEIRNPQQFKNRITIFQQDIPTIRAISGEEYLVLPLRRSKQNVYLPEMSVHFMIMYLMGMFVRYYLKEMGEIIKGDEKGDKYVVQKFLKITTRKFPNLILNELWKKDFVFVGPQLKTEKQLDIDQMESIYEYVLGKMATDMRGSIY